MKQNSINSKLIAPCGMNCAVCIGYLREKNKCPGCNYNGNKPSYCLNCIIKNCEHFTLTNSKFCFDCERFPCKRLRNLDKRYRTKYGMSMLENLEFIKTKGIRKFIANEKERWTCKACDNLISVHKLNCPKCGAVR